MKKQETNDERLGLNQEITRRDFLNASLIGAGSTLLATQSPLELLAGQKAKTQDDWSGYGGVGDYASSHGNTPEVIRVSHDIRDGKFDQASAEVIDLKESFDVVIVGGGFSGLGAAYYLKRTGRGNQKCLLLDQHPIFGGVAKANEFIVNGQRLLGPQGSNDFMQPAPAALPPDKWRDNARATAASIYAELKMPTHYEFQKWDERPGDLQFGLDNFGPMYWTDHEVSVGYFFEQKMAPKMVKDMWRNDLRDVPLPENIRRDLLRWRTTTEKPYQGEDYDRWLDSMTYKDYLEKVLKLDPAVTAYIDPPLAAAAGFGSDVTSAWNAARIGLPGVNAYLPQQTSSRAALQSFPGGNAAIIRHLVKTLIPAAISGKYEFGDIQNGRVNFAALDRAGQPFRMRLNATAVRVEHAGSPANADHVLVTYVQNGKAYRIKARGVVMATGGWINRYVALDLPEEYRAAYEKFHHAPMLVANVALTNWRFMHKLGVTACRWFDDYFGFSCNIRRPMLVGNYRPPLHPDQPIIMTFYVPLVRPGKPVRQQGAIARGELLSTSFREYERRIRARMVRMFGAAGFDPRRDVAGLILNRWGHAYVCPAPGFHFGRDGQPAPRDVVKKRYGRIAFGHAEFEGHQNYSAALINGVRAMHQVMEVL